MSGLIEWLENLNVKDTRVRAVLKRSLAFEPGEYPLAYPYVEPFIGEKDSAWKRKMLYLVAGLWAMHWREGRSVTPLPIGRACAAFQALSQSSSTEPSSTERRFITLLDSDGDQLSHRLRQMVALLKDQSIDFEAVLHGLLYWNDDRKRTQNAWARDFYRNMKTGSGEQPTTQWEVAQ